MSLFASISYCVFLLMAFTSVAYSWCRMRGSLFSKEVKMLILKRHIAYIVAYAILNTYLLLVTTFNFMKQFGGEHLDEWVDQQCQSTYA